MPDDFFNERKPWSERKHRLLANYLPPFVAKVGSVAVGHVVYCVDCFAGAAKYGEDTEGSPLLMIRAADQADSWRKPVNLKLIFIEPDPENYASLKEHTRACEERGFVTNIKGEFGPTVRNLLSQLGDSPALFFIDPFGPKEIPFSDIQPILTRPHSITELIINFDADGLTRIADSAVTFHTDPRVVKSNETKEKLVTQILGGENWKLIYRDKNLNFKQREEAILNLYIEKLRQYGYKVVAYPIREQIDKPAKYYYIYCTRHPDGIALMNDFVRKEEDLIYGEHVELKMSLFVQTNPFEQAQNERREKLKELVLEYLNQNPRVTRSKIKSDFISKHFGEFHGKDYNHVVKELIEKRILREVNSGKIRINDNDILEFFPNS